jgi:hypothetical protein
MNQAKEAFRQVLSKMPKGGGGAGGGPQGSAIASMVQSVAILGGVGYLGYNSFFTVPPGHKAVVWNRYSGLADKVEGEGLILRVRVGAAASGGTRRAAAHGGARRDEGALEGAPSSHPHPTLHHPTRPVRRFHATRYARHASRFRCGSTPTSVTCAPGRATCSRSPARRTFRWSTSPCASSPSRR